MTVSGGVGIDLEQKVKYTGDIEDNGKVVSFDGENGDNSDHHESDNLLGLAKLWWGRTLPWNCRPKVVIVIVIVFVIVIVIITIAIHTNWHDNCGFQDHQSYL